MLEIEKNAISLEIEELVSKYGKGRQSLLPVVQEIQKKYNFISEFSQQEIAKALDIHPVEVYGVVTFYAFLGTNYSARYNVRLCRTISCDLAGKESVARSIIQELGIDFGEATQDNKFTLDYINCMGMCDQGPAMLINDQVHTHLTPSKVVDILKNCQ